MSLPKQIKSKIIGAVSSSSSATTTIFDFSSSSVGTYDNTLIAFEAGTARLLDFYGPSGPGIGGTAVFVASFHTGLAANYSMLGGTLGASISFGSPTNTGGKLDMTSGTTNLLSFDPTMNVPMGPAFTYRAKVTPNWNGNPASSQELLTSMFNQSDDTNDVRFRIDTDGKMYWDTKGNTGNKSISAAFGASAGQEAEICGVCNYNTGLYLQFKGGTLWGTPPTGAQTRRNWIGYFQLGQPYVNINAISNYFIRDVVLYATALFTTNYVAGYTVMDTKYSITTPSITTNQVTGVNSITKVKTVWSSSGSDTIKVQVIVGSQAKYYNGSAWVNSDGTYTQSSTIAAFESNISTLALSNSTVKFVFLFFSNNGFSTPWLDSLTVTYT